MRDFILGIDLWANIVGGIVAAAILALVAYLWNLRKHRILRELTEIMTRAIDHRHKGKSRKFADDKEWIEKAKKIEHDAMTKARELSHTAGSLVAWRDRAPTDDEDTEIESHISHLSMIIDRIRGLMERHA
jgi:DNA-directed RNA polymerase delta subunit